MSVEKSFMRGAKFLGITFELALLYSAMLPDGESVSIGVVTAVLLSVFSMSFSAFASLFDDGLLPRYASGPRWIRGLLKIAVATTIISLVVAFFFMALAYRLVWTELQWGLLSVGLGFLAFPRLFVYLGDFAYSVIGIGSQGKTVIKDHISDGIQQFDGR